MSSLRLAHGMGLLTVTACLLIHAGRAAAQQSVGGVAVDLATRRPLAGAQVVLDGREMLTDNRGQFLFPDVGGTEVSLRILMIGYRPLTQTVAVGRTDLELALMQSTITLDEFIVTGTPQQQVKRALGNAVGTVDVGKVVEVASPPKVENLLNSVAGVGILSGGGDIGAGASIRMRGISTLSLSSQPLLYIDGVRVSNTVNNGPGVDGRSPPSRLNDINPDEIESIQVIKGPAAATLYGTEASNGVVQIITKRGLAGRPVWSFSLKQGANWLPDPETLFPPVYYRDAAGEIVEFHPLRSDRITGEFPGDTISYGPWFRTGHPQEYEANVSGGTGPLNYFFAGAYSHDEGPVSYNWLNRLSTRANLSYTPDERLSVDFGISFIKSRYRSAGAAQPISVTIIWACPSPGCEPGRGLPGGVDGPTRGYLTGPPERYEEDYEGYEDLGRGIITSTVRHQPFSWFSHRLTLGADFTSQRLSSLARLSQTIGASQTGSRNVENYTEDLANLDYAAVATTRVTSALSLETAAGFQYYQKQTTEVTATGSTFPVRALETVSSGAIRGGMENFLENKTVGLYLQEQISWKNRIFLTGAVRGDDNSAFGKNYDFVVYPKLSASWVLTDEPFLSSVALLNSLRVRSAWGRAGQQPEAFAALRIYEPSSGQAGTPTLTPSNIGNPDLKPEVGEEIEAGFDGTLFDERLGLEFTYYSKRTRDAILGVPVAPSVGFPGSQFQNVGEIANRGVEVGVRASASHGTDLQLDLNLKYSRNTNEVVSLGSGPSQVISAPFGQYNVVGFPLGGIFMTRVVSADLDRSGAVPRAMNIMCESGDRVPGTNFSRGGGPSVPCAEAPQVYWGAATPTWDASASATLTLLRTLQLYGQVDAMGGHTLLSGDIRASLMSFRNQIAIIEASDPILLAYDVLDIRRQPGTIKAGFAKLRDVSATYTFPRALTQRLGVSRSTLTISLRNLWTIWREQLGDFGVRHVDTELRSNTNDQTAYYQEGWPQLRRFLATIRVTF